MTFDPYYKWLAIPPIEQPPNLYRLLGVNLFEHDPDVIEMAADQRMTHVRAFQCGPNSDISQGILNELAAARLTLLTAEKKIAYDGALQAQMAARASSLRQLAPPALGWSAPPWSAKPPGLTNSEPIAAPAIACPAPSRSAEPLEISLAEQEHPLQFLAAPAEASPDDFSTQATSGLGRVLLLRRRRTRRTTFPWTAVLLVLAPIAAVVFTIVVARTVDLDDETKPRRLTAPLSARPTERATPGTHQPGLRSHDINQPPKQPASAIQQRRESVAPPAPVNNGFSRPQRQPIDVEPGGAPNPDKGANPPADVAAVDASKVQTITTPIESKLERLFVLNFDQDEIRIQIPTEPIPGEAEVQLEILDPKEKLVESKAKVRTSQRLLLNAEPRIEVTFEAKKIKPDLCLLKITPWIGNQVKGIQCNLSRLQKLQANLPGQIEGTQAAFESASSDAAAWDSHLQSLLNENHGAPGVDPSGQIQQQVAIREARAKLTALQGRRAALGRTIDKWTAQVNELPSDIQLVTGFVGTTVRYRMFYSQGEKEIQIRVQQQAAVAK